MVTLSLKPVATQKVQARGSSFVGGDLSSAFSRLSVARAPQAPKERVVPVEMKRVCKMTGKRRNNGWSVTFSHKRSHKVQEVNLQTKMIYWPEEERYVRMKIATSTLKTIQRHGIAKVAKDNGVNLYKLPYRDVSENRLKWLEEHKGEVPVSKKAWRGRTQFRTVMQPKKEGKWDTERPWMRASKVAEENAAAASA